MVKYSKKHEPEKAAGNNGVVGRRRQIPRFGISYEPVPAGSSIRSRAALAP